MDVRTQQEGKLRTIEEVARVRELDAWSSGKSDPVQPPNPFRELLKKLQGSSV